MDELPPGVRFCHLATAVGSVGQRSASAHQHRPKCLSTDRRVPARLQPASNPGELLLHP